jgi:hypothetical protein
MRQFGTWARGIGGFLAHHGVAGFLSNVNDLRATDEDDRRWAAFLATWQRRHGGKPMRAREIFASAQVDELDRQLLDPWDGNFITTDRGTPVRNPTQLTRIGPSRAACHRTRPHRIVPPVIRGFRVRVPGGRPIQLKTARRRPDAIESPSYSKKVLLYDGGSLRRPLAEHTGELSSTAAV